MSVHGIDMYITHYVHTMSVRVYDMFVIFGFGIYMSTHIVKFTNMSATCLSPSIGQGCRWHVYTMYVHVFARWSGFQMYQYTGIPVFTYIDMSYVGTYKYVLVWTGMYWYVLTSGAMRSRTMKGSVNMSIFIRSPVILACSLPSMYMSWKWAA